ncbi:MAG: DUF2029 domain-containing protein [Planctomycetes bacterium]|nr:DUF2029 domain-containing protein [Planctomycetota bacterium]MCW8135481.1 DUF2029 domain-containing protein [Planctomycetota bacterium]
MTWILAVLMSASLIGGQYIRHGHEGAGFDFGVYHAAANALPAAPESLYQWADPDTGATAAGAHYLYPPAFAAWLAPLSALPRNTAFTVWNVLIVGLYGATFLVLRRAMAKARIREFRARALLSALAVSPILLIELYFGQVNVLVLFLVVLALHARLNGKPASAGLIIAIAAGVKVLPVVLLFMAMHGKWQRIAAGFAAGILVVIASPWAVLALHQGPVNAAEANWSLHQNYVQDVVLARGAGLDPTLMGGDRPGNFSFQAVSWRLAEKAARFVSGNPAFTLDGTARQWWRRAGLAAGIVLLGLAACMVWLTRHNRAAMPMLWGVLPLAANLANPTMWVHHLMILMLVLAPTGSMRRRFPWPAVACVITPWLLVMPYLAWALPDAGWIGGNSISRIMDWGISTAFLAATVVAAALLAWHHSRPRIRSDT